MIFNNAIKEKYKGRMTAKSLPIKLGKEPLIDVVCGVSFASDTPMDSLLPGLLLPKLAERQIKFEPFPLAQLPEVVRLSDPNLQDAPLMRIIVDDQFAVLIGTRSLAVSCLMPYVGWANFKEMTQLVLAVLGDNPFVHSIERHSLRYVDFIRNNGSMDTLSRFNLHIEVAGRRLSDQVTQIRTEITEGHFLHATTIVSPATTNRPDGSIADHGAVVDVDTHRLGRYEVGDFIYRLPVLLDEIHDANKTFFFDLLSESGLHELEPVYE